MRVFDTAAPGGVETESPAATRRSGACSTRKRGHSRFGTPAVCTSAKLSTPAKGSNRTCSPFRRVYQPTRPAAKPPPKRT